MPESQSQPQPQSQSETWHEVVLRQKYNDPLKLKNSLDSMYGQDRYKVRVKSGRYILQLKLQEPPPEGQIAELERAISFHYK
ncbi:uncharacterized protein F4812DRAFT_132306 [Daldinia caldariorum]|uniref:uncharacterized protein n=1 Tax=Daldinia caldariorum TaxID=326644 RepID=UPI002008D4DA|nr:uncharacterized protein F4812DRAFT_132306 [Daldinia caldariorum]KAI1465107.1 hypothetical protein F4812DRAFT_132306 [Daldinia caldariorum]